ncbi:hypothetical protein EDD22DRAFT_850311 [Suillus occidentalis]|nr:hypothetical protein EDD22DRAFT_850311 [Suillus occidentalis]
MPSTQALSSPSPSATALSSQLILPRHRNDAPCRIHPGPSHTSDLVSRAPYPPREMWTKQICSLKKGGALMRSAGRRDQNEEAYTHDEGGSRATLHLIVAHSLHRRHPTHRPPPSPLRTVLAPYLPGIEDAEPLLAFSFVDHSFARPPLPQQSQNASHELKSITVINRNQSKYKQHPLDASISTILVLSRRVPKAANPCSEDMNARDVFIQSQAGSGKTTSFPLHIMQGLHPLSTYSYIDRSTTRSSANTSSFNVGRCRWLVLDEVDRLMVFGFEDADKGIVQGLDRRRKLASQVVQDETTLIRPRAIKGLDEEKAEDSPASKYDSELSYSQH